MIQVDQIACLKGASEGNRKPTEAGIIFGQDKYMLITQVDGTSLLTSKKGGGAVMKTKSAYVVGLWYKDKKMSNGMNQNGSDCADQVTGMASYLADMGY